MTREAALADKYHRLLDIVRGIEVGHVFALGHEYSQAMGATYLAADGQSRVLEMGCYGIGVKGPYDELGNTVAVNESNGNLYVTDPNEIEQPWEPRIQAFDSSGQFIGQTQLPVGISVQVPV